MAWLLRRSNKALHDVQIESKKVFDESKKVADHLKHDAEFVVDHVHDGGVFIVDHVKEGGDLLVKGVIKDARFAGKFIGRGTEKENDAAAQAIQNEMRARLARAELEARKQGVTSVRCIGPLIGGSAAGAGPTGKYSVIQWETSVFYTYEGEINGQPVPFGEKNPPMTMMSIGAARLGCSEGEAKFQWSTFDMSARAGVHYKGVKPTWVTFEDGETYKDLVVEVYPRSQFDGTVELGIYIDEKSVVGAVVGKYLHTSTIKIIDSSCFPDDKLREWVLGGDNKKIKEVSPAALVWYFIKVCTMNPVCWAGTKKTILAAQWHNAMAILYIFIIYFLVQTLNDTAMSSVEKELKVTMFAALWLGPFTVTHYVTYRRQFWKVGGSLRKAYQALLLKKFLNYTDDSRNQVAIESLVMAMVRDVNTSVGEGYLCAIDLVFGSCCKVLYLVAAMIYLQVSSGNINLPPLAAALVLPIVSLAYLKFRQTKTFSLRAKQFKAENGSVNHVIKSVINYQLVADYDRRTFMIETFERKLDGVNETTTQFNAAGVNSRFFTPWVTNIFVALFIVSGGVQVVHGESDLATFLSTISLFRSLGGEFEKAYVESLRITAAYASIAQVTMYMNLPVDVPARLKMGRARRKLGRELRTAERIGIADGSRKKLGPSEVAADRLPILISNIEFSYGDAAKLEDPEAEAGAEAAEAAALAAKHAQMKRRLSQSYQGLKIPRISLIRDEHSSPRDGATSGLASTDLLQPVAMMVDGGASLVEATVNGVSVATTSVVHGVSALATTTGEGLKHAGAATGAGLKHAGDDIKHAGAGLMTSMHIPPINFTPKAGGFTPQGLLGGRGLFGASPKAGSEPLLKDSGALKTDVEAPPPGAEGDRPSLPAGVKGLKMEIAQGKLMAIVGPPSQGKATILRLLAGQIFPKLPSLIPGAPVDPNTRAELFVPPHLRVVQIQENPMILGPEESIFDNLVYGIKKSPSLDWKAIEKRARQIMERLGLNETLLKDHFKEAGFLGANGVRITRSDRQLISLGRAFVMNPEIIICHKPTALLDDIHTEHVLLMFREYVENRGLFMPSDEPLVKRRRRTLIFTAKNEHVAAKADEIYVAHKGLLTKIDFMADETPRSKIEKIKTAFGKFNAELNEEHKKLMAMYKEADKKPAAIKMPKAFLKRRASVTRSPHGPGAGAVEGLEAQVPDGIGPPGGDGTPAAPKVAPTKDGQEPQGGDQHEDCKDEVKSPPPPPPPPPLQPSPITARPPSRMAVRPTAAPPPPQICAASSAPTRASPVSQHRPFQPNVTAVSVVESRDTTPAVPRQAAAASRAKGQPARRAKSPAPLDRQDSRPLSSLSRGSSLDGSVENL